MASARAAGRWLASQIQDPHKFRRMNGVLTIFWVAMIPISLVFHLLSSVAYVALLSIYALFATHLGAWAASRTEARQVDDADIDTNHANVTADEVDINAP